MIEAKYISNSSVEEELRKQIGNAEQAQALLNNPVAEAFFSSTQEALLTGAERIFDNAKSTAEEKEAILSSIVFFRRFKRFVEHTLEDGLVSKKRLDELTKSGKNSFLGGIF